MIMIAARFSLLAISICASTVAIPTDFEVYVTRQASDIYEVQSEPFIIKTRYCYEYVYGERSLLRMNGYSGDIIFIDSGGQCDVEAVFKRSDQNAGKYIVTVTNEDEDWYSMLENSLFIKTDSCLDISIGAEAILTIHAYGGGTLNVNGNECVVEAIYETIRF